MLQPIAAGIHVSSVVKSRLVIRRISATMLGEAVIYF
jgi:hypothetical protein